MASRTTFFCSSTIILYIRTGSFISEILGYTVCRLHWVLVYPRPACIQLYLNVRTWPCFGMLFHGRPLLSRNSSIKLTLLVDSVISVETVLTKIANFMDEYLENKASFWWAVFFCWSVMIPSTTWQKFSKKSGFWKKSKKPVLTNNAVYCLLYEYAILYRLREYAILDEYTVYKDWYISISFTPSFLNFSNFSLEVLYLASKFLIKVRSTSMCFIK